jgi:hypothetical protein
MLVKRVWRYQRGNISKNRQHNGQKEKVQKDKQRSTKHTYRTKDPVTRTPIKIGGYAVPAPLVASVVTFVLDM